MSRTLHQYFPLFFLHTDTVFHILDTLHLDRVSELTDLGSVRLVRLQFPPLHVTGDPHHGWLLQLPELVCVLHVLDNLHLDRISKLAELGSVDIVGLQFPLQLYIAIDPHRDGLLELPELGGVTLQYMDLAGLFCAMEVSYSTTPS